MIPLDNDDNDERLMVQIEEKFMFEYFYRTAFLSSAEEIRERCWRGSADRPKTNVTGADDCVWM